MNKTELIKSLIAENPLMPSSSLAKMVYSQHKHLFTDVESARSRIRYYRKELKGGHGFTPNPVGMRTEKQKKQAQGWRKLPESKAELYEDFMLPKACNRILLLSDIHFPYHDVRALEIALQHGLDNTANCVILNGDILDMYMLSRFIKDPRQVSIGDELEILTDFLRLLKERFNCPIYFKWGNHEERWETFLKVKAPELLSIAEFRLDVFCKFGEIGVIEIKDKRIVKAGELSILHGHEFASSVFSPVNPARGYYLRAKRTMIAGHNHQSSEHNEKDISGKVTTCWSTGCLCDLNPAYLPLNKWNHGFAFIKVEKDGSFEVDNLRIIDGVIR